MTDGELMQIALEEARLAAAEGEVPVGAVVAKDGEVVARAHNRREADKNATAHAELLAIDAACRYYTWDARFARMEQAWQRLFSAPS